LEHAREQSYHPFLPERKQVSSRRWFNTNPTQLVTEKSCPLPRPAGYTDLPASTRTAGKTCPRAELLGFPHVPQEAEKNKDIMLSSRCYYTDESPLHERPGE